MLNGDPLGFTTTYTCFWLPDRAELLCPSFSRYPTVRRVWKSTCPPSVVWRPPHEDHSWAHWPMAWCRRTAPDTDLHGKLGNETGNGINSIQALTYMASWHDRMYRDAADSANLRHSAPSCSQERAVDVAELWAAAAGLHCVAGNVYPQLATCWLSCTCHKAAAYHLSHTHRHITPPTLILVIIVYCTLAW